MIKNRLLNIAINICRFIRLIYILIFIALTTMFIHFQVAPDSYEEVNYNYQSSSFQFTKFTKWKVKDAGEDKEVYALDNISTGSLFVNYIKLTAVFIFMFLAVKEFQKVMQSVKSLKTFQDNNVISFRRIGKYVLVIFLLTSYYSIEFKQGGFSGFNISLTPLLFMLFAFIMAEIFKEGNTLQEENKLTI